MMKKQKNKGDQLTLKKIKFSTKQKNNNLATNSLDMKTSNSNPHFKKFKLVNDYLLSNNKSQNSFYLPKLNLNVLNNSNKDVKYDLIKAKNILNRIKNADN